MSAVAELTRVLEELHQLERELLEQRYVRRADGMERIGEALQRLGEAGSPAAIIARSAEALGAASDFDLVLVSRLERDLIRPHALWLRADEVGTASRLAALERLEIRLAYPLVEAEVAQRHEAMLVSLAASGRRAAPELASVLGWEAYAVVDVALEGKTAGFVYAAYHDAAALSELDRELLARYAEGLAQTFERAVLREHLQRQQLQLGAAGRWIGGRLLQLSHRPPAGGVPIPTGPDTDLASLLTPRELGVLRLIARGRSNPAIAAALAIGEGTVKYHVKNVLRKLQARSRAEAVTRYMRLTGWSDGQ